MLGLALYIPTLATGAANTGHAVRRQYISMNADPESSGGLAFFSTLVGVPVGYIIFWGLPASLLGWCLVGVLALVAGGLAAAAAVGSDG